MLSQPVQRGIVAWALGLATLAATPTSPSAFPKAATPAASAKVGAGMFLVARRGLPDPNFTETVVLLLSYGPGGALGVVVNRPSDVELSVLTPRIAGLEDRDDPLYIGGPVPGDELFVLVRADAPPDGAEPVFGDVSVSRDPEVLRTLAREGVPAGRLRVYAGYAGWAPGQLDHELERRDWYVVEPDAESIFTSRPVETWNRLIPPAPTEQVRASPRGRDLHARELRVPSPSG